MCYSLNQYVQFLEFIKPNDSIITNKPQETEELKYLVDNITNFYRDIERYAESNFVLKHFNYQKQSYIIKTISNKILSVSLYDNGQIKITMIPIIKSGMFSTEYIIYSMIETDRLLTNQPMVNLSYLKEIYLKNEVKKLLLKGFTIEELKNITLKY